jgi:Tfp pilus assembly protein PilX
MLLILVMTVLGIAAITATSMQNRMASFGRSGEAGASAAESCVSTAVKLIQQTLDNGSLPSTFLDNATPAGPVPSSNATTLNQEIMGQSDNNADTASLSPNLMIPNPSSTVNSFTVRGDIDRLYAAPKAGGSLQFAAGYEGAASGAASGGVDILYRVDCVATNAATNTTSRITAVYACTVTGESCQRKI